MAVLKGEAEPALLDTHNTERLSVGGLAAEKSDESTDEHEPIRKEFDDHCQDDPHGKQSSRLSISLQFFNDHSG